MFQSLDVRLARYLLALIPLSAPTSVSALEFDSYRPLNDKIISGEFDTHVRLPIDRPQVYALSFEFHDELVRRCDLPFSHHHRNMRDVMYSMFSQYYTAYAKRERLPKDTSFLQGTGVLLKGQIAAVLPVKLARESIQAGELVEAALVLNGGCRSSATRQLADNLAAIGTFSRLKHIKVQGPLRLVREAVTDNNLTLSCTYDANPQDAEELNQVHTAYTAATIASYTSMFPILLESINKNSQRTQNWDFLRPQCPATPDPSFPVQKHYVPIKLDPTKLHGNSRAERLANFFLDVHIPREGRGTDGKPAQLDAATRDAIRQEIIKYETIDVSAAEIAESVERERKMDRDRGAPRSSEPLAEVQRRHEARLRSTKYREAHGEKLFELAHSAKANNRGIPHYIYARDSAAMMAIK